MFRAFRLRRRHGLLLAVTGVAAVFAAFVSPAAGGLHERASIDAICAPGSEWSSVNTIFRTSASARGAADQPREPSLNQTIVELPDRAKGKGGPGFKATVPLWFHVVHAGGVGNISQTIIGYSDDPCNSEFTAGQRQRRTRGRTSARTDSGAFRRASTSRPEPARRPSSGRRRAC